MAIKSHLTGLGMVAQVASAVVGGVNTTTVAAGSNQASATLLPIAAAFVILSGTGGVILAPGTGSADALSEGDTVSAANYSGSSINVYPPTGGKIANGSANAAFAVGNGKEATFRCIDGLNFTANLSA